MSSNLRNIYIFTTRILLMKVYVLITLLLTALLPGRYLAGYCLPLEYRISSYKGYSGNIESSLTFNFDIQFYNPNNVNMNLHLSTTPLDPLYMIGELKNENLTAMFFAGVGQALSSYQFTPGVSTIPTSVSGRIDNPQNITLTSFPDGNYIVSYFYANVVTGFPLILEVADGEITPKISMPDWNYEKQGTVFYEAWSGLGGWVG